MKCHKVFERCSNDCWMFSWVAPGCSASPAINSSKRSSVFSGWCGACHMYSVQWDIQIPPPKNSNPKRPSVWKRMSEHHETSSNSKFNFPPSCDGWSSCQHVRAFEPALSQRCKTMVTFVSTLCGGLGTCIFLWWDATGCMTDCYVRAGDRVHVFASGHKQAGHGGKDGMDGMTTCSCRGHFAIGGVTHAGAFCILLIDAMLAMSFIRCQDEYVVALGAYDLHFSYELFFPVLCWHFSLTGSFGTDTGKYQLNCFEISASTQWAPPKKNHANTFNLNVPKSPKDSWYQGSHPCPSPFGASTAESTRTEVGQRG